MLSKVLVSPALTSWVMSDWGIGISLAGMAAWGIIMTSPRFASAYEKHPLLRLCCLLAQRATKLVGCLLSLGVVQAQHLDLALLGYFLTVGQYMFIGWQAGMTVVSTIAGLTDQV